MPKNVINSKIDFTNVLNSTKLGLSEKFKKKIKFMKNPYLKKKEIDFVIKKIKQFYGQSTNEK